MAIIEKLRAVVLVTTSSTNQSHQVNSEKFNLVDFPGEILIKIAGYAYPSVKLYLIKNTEAYSKLTVEETVPLALTCKNLQQCVQKARRGSVFDIDTSSVTQLDAGELLSTISTSNLKTELLLHPDKQPQLINNIKSVSLWNPFISSYPASFWNSLSRQPGSWYEVLAKMPKLQEISVTLAVEQSIEYHISEGRDQELSEMLGYYKFLRTEWPHTRRTLEILSAHSSSSVTSPIWQEFAKVARLLSARSELANPCTVSILYDRRYSFVQTQAPRPRSSRYPSQPAPRSMLCPEYLVEPDHKLAKSQPSIQAKHIFKNGSVQSFSFNINDTDGSELWSKTFWGVSFKTT